MDFESKTVVELKDIARANSLKNWSKLKKQDLIQFLIDNNAAVGGARARRPRSPSPGRPRSRPPSPGRPRSRSPSPGRQRPPSPGRPRSRSPSPGRQRPPSPGRPRSRSPSPGRQRPPSPGGSQGFRTKLKKPLCNKNLRNDVVAEAEDYGISITKTGGKKKTIKELCVEIDQAKEEQRRVMPIPATPPMSRPRSPMRMPRPPTPPIDVVPEGVIPRAIVYTLLNIDRDMPRNKFLKDVKKPALVRYAEELGIRGKSLAKGPLLDRIVAKKIAETTPVIAQAIEAEASAITDEIAQRVSDRVEASGEEAPPNEEIQAVVEERISTGESINPDIVAEEIVALLSRSSVSSSTRDSVVNSVSAARDINSTVAENIISEVVDKTDRTSVQQAINEVVEDQGVNLDIDVGKLEQVVSDEQAREAIEKVISTATDNGVISEVEGDIILQPLKDEAANDVINIPGPSRPSRPTGTRPKTSPQRKPQPVDVRRVDARGERDIANLLREIQKPEESISNMPVIQNRVFRCLGLVN